MDPENHTDDSDPRNQKIQGIPLIIQKTEKHLNQRQLVDYAEERRDMLRWLLTLGKDPERGEGYAQSTLKPNSYRMDQFYRWVWNHEGGYTTDITTEHGDRYFEELKLRETSNEDKNQRLKDSNASTNGENTGGTATSGTPTSPSKPNPVVRATSSD